MRKVEKYSDDWILRLASSVGKININPLKYRKPKWWSRLFGLSKKGLLKKERVSCAEFNFTLTDEGKAFMKGDK
jgi:hypothetical protein